jgi:hypothetical protein
MLLAGLLLHLKVDISTFINIQSLFHEGVGAFGVPASTLSAEAVFGQQVAAGAQPQAHVHLCKVECSVLLRVTIPSLILLYCSGGRGTLGGRKNCYFSYSYYRWLYAL